MSAFTCMFQGGNLRIGVHQGHYSTIPVSKQGGSSADLYKGLFEDISARGLDSSPCNGGEDQTSSAMAKE